MPSGWGEMALNGCLSNNTSGESGHWTMASSDAANHDDDLTEQELLEEQSKREEREREKTLQKRIGELQTQTQRLERRIMLLRTENDTLKKKQEDQKPLEEKIKVLKKRNAELATIARRLEEKAKALQQENVRNKARTKEEGAVDGEHLKRMFARQRAKDLAEHAKNMLSKDREIEELRRKCQELADQLSNGDVMAPENVQIYEEKEELVNIVKQAAKERLQLEQQLAHSKSRERSEGDDQEREKQRRELEAANDILHKEIEKLEQALKYTEGLKENLSQKSQECEALTSDLTHLKEQQAQLEDELRASSAKNVQLAETVSDLERRLKDFDKVNEECSTLRVTLAAAQTDRESAKEQVSTLQTRVNSLENLVRDLQESAEQLRSLEHEYKDALSQLASKQQQIDQLHEAQKESKAEHQQSVTELQAKIRELERKCQAQEQRQEELKEEVQTLRRQKQDHDDDVVHHAQRVQQQQQTAAPAPAPAPAPASRRQGSPVTPGGIPPSDSADSGLPASGANSDEGVSQCGQGKGANGSHALDTSTARDSSSKSHDTEPEDSGMESHNDARSELVLLNDSRLSALATRGPIQVYVAKYSYNPFEYSPNENPEAELQLNAGDYVLVLGDMDEDGFFEGELIDGRRGLVPSNFIERVAEEDLAEFHAALALSGSADDSNHSAKPVPSPLDSDNEDVSADNYGISGQLDKNVLNNNNNNSYDTPAPQQLVLERQLTNSVLISWRAPHGLDPGSIQAYHVYLNGVLKATLKGSERTKALLEGVDANQNHRVSVHCLSNQGQSKDSQCTMLIGRDVLPVPSELGVRSVTQNSACVHWMPGNSNCPHAILLNGRETKVVRPGVCQHTLTGLAPGTVYRVTIATKPAPGTYGERHKWSQDKVSCNIEFKTLVGGGVPDPPLNVQVELGPREGTLLLTWLPVTINSSGFSNGAVVTGYVVYADGNRIKEAKGPTNDHMVLAAEDFKGCVPKKLTVRTATVDQLESVDSAAVRLPPALIREVTAGTARAMATEAVRATNLRKSPRVSGTTADHPGHETDEEIEAAFQEAENSSPEIEAQVAEPFPESSSSELSDILEVEEEMGGDEPCQNGDTSLANSHSQVEKIRKSPRPAPRKLSPSPAPPAGVKEAEFSLKKFHGQKPDPSGKDGLLTTPMIVPAIEITRDSSTERGASFDEDVEEGGSPRPTSATDPSTLRQQPRQRSLEDGVEKPLPPHDPISQRYRSSGDEPSAFRSVEQGRQRSAVPDARSPDSATNAELATSPTRQSGSRPRSGSAHSSPSHKAKGEGSREEKRPSSGHSDVPPPKPARRTPEHEEVNDRDSITDEINHLIDDSTVRLFIALFDYDPMTMSPNVDCVDEELPFREGQILKVYGDKDADGFYRGEADGREGYIPCNMVSEIHIDDPELVEQLLKENQTNTQQSSAADGKGEGHLTSNGVAPLPAQGPVRRMVALYDYDPQELSPNVDAEVELAFKQGDIIYIIGDMDEDGFYSGELGGVRGLVPSNFLQDAPLSDEDEVLESASMVSPSRSQGSISAASRHSDSLSVLNNPSRKDRLSLSPPVERTIVLDIPSDQSAASPAADEEKRKKKGGFLNKGRSILKKFTR